MFSENSIHQFAFFIEKPLSGSLIVISDPILYHRIIRVLKCKIAEKVILFNQQRHAQAQLINYSKKECTFKIITIENNSPLLPIITLGLPLLKGNDLEEAVSFATQVGVSNIQLLVTNRSQRPFSFSAEKKRLMRVIIAATEQSKRFCMPTIQEPIPFCELKNSYPNDIFFFGMKDGISMHTLLSYNVMKNEQSSFLFVVGPEADFSLTEYDQLKEWKAEGISLGPTVLRSCTAASIGINYLRMLTL